MLYQLSYFRVFQEEKRANLGYVELQKRAFARLAQDFRNLTSVLYYLRFFAESPPSWPQVLKVGGRGWIRTTEALTQQIYSLPHLATLENTQIVPDSD